jgi:hypothetical protein
MTMTEDQYKSPEEWQKYILANADHFTVVSFRPFTKYEKPTLEEARDRAKELIAERLRPEDVLIYAVYQGRDAYVETVKSDKNRGHRAKEKA